MLTLKEWRRAKGITQQEVADACGCHVNTYSRWELDPERIPLGEAHKIAEYIGVSFDDINFLPEKSTNNVDIPERVEV